MNSPGKETMSWRKMIILLAGPALLPLLAVSPDAGFLKVECAVLPKTLSRGEEGIVQIRITVPEGIIVSPLPDFVIEFKPCPALAFPKNFFTASDMEIETLEAEGEEFLNLDRALKIPFTVRLEAVRGSHILEGRVKYFARSKKEGWCLKTTSKFFISFFTRASVKKKT